MPQPSRPSRTRRRPAAAAAAILLAGYLPLMLLVLLSPFRFEPLSWTNPVERLPEDGAIAFTGRGIVLSPSLPQRLRDDLSAGAGMSLEAWAAAAHPRQEGPARIVTYSDGWRARNLTLGQEGPHLEVRLRTSRNGANGTEPHLIVVLDVFAEPRLRHILLTFDPGRATGDGRARTRVFVDGALAWDGSTPEGDLSTWDPAHRLALGNETTGRRHWEGRLHGLAIYDRALEPAEAEALWRRAASGRPLLAEHLVAAYDFAGDDWPVIRDRSGRQPPLDLEVPPRHGEAPLLILRPYGELSGPDGLRSQVAEMVANVLILVPVGFLGFLALPSPRRPAARAAVTLVAIFLLVVTVEGLQLFLADRYTSVTDLLHNCLGGLLGIGLAARGTRWLAWLSRVLPDPA